MKSGSLAKIIKRRSAELGITINEIANRAGLEASTVWKILNGETKKPERDTVLKLGYALELTLIEVQVILWELGHKLLGNPDSAF